MTYIASNYSWRTWFFPEINNWFGLHSKKKVILYLLISIESCYSPVFPPSPFTFNLSGLLYAVVKQLDRSTTHKEFLIFYSVVPPFIWLYTTYNTIRTLMKTILDSDFVTSRLELPNSRWPNWEMWTINHAMTKAKGPKLTILFPWWTGKINYKNSRPTIKSWRYYWPGVEDE